MGEAPATRASLLVRLRDSHDQAAWRQFVDLYAPLIYQFARRRGLQDADAADVTQVVLQALPRSVQRLDYDPRRGTFRGWLFAVVRNQLHKFRDRQRRSPPGAGDSATRDLLDHQPARPEDDEVEWERQYERQLFERAAGVVLRVVEAASWQAFWRTAVEGRPAGEVACELGMTVGAVYTAKSRVLDRIGKELRRIQTE
jgi:RNA polymerase sigma-70 factor (ECF subfamily)